MTATAATNTPCRLDSQRTQDRGQRTESRKYTNNMSLMPVNAGSITAASPVALEVGP